MWYIFKYINISLQFTILLLYHPFALNVKNLNILPSLAFSKDTRFWYYFLWKIKNKKRKYLHSQGHWEQSSVIYEDYTGYIIYHIWRGVLDNVSCTSLTLNSFIWRVKSKRCFFLFGRTLELKSMRFSFIEQHSGWWQFVASEMFLSMGLYPVHQD